LYGFGKRLVEKLDLLTTPYTKPYNLQCLSEKGEIIVNKQVLDSFCDEKYKEEVLCDMVPIEACHMLWERPWKFDRKVYLDSLSNKLSFEYMGKKVVLKPLIPRGIHEYQIKMKNKREQEKKEEIK